MKKQKKQKKSPPLRKVFQDVVDELADDADEVNWKPLIGAFREAFEWALDVAAALAREYPEEVAAVERVREFMRARLAGKPAMVSVDDVLLTFGLLIGAIERDLGPINILGPLAMHFPTSPEFAPRVPRVLITRPVSPHDASTHFIA